MAKMIMGGPPRRFCFPRLLTTSTLLFFFWRTLSTTTSSLMLSLQHRGPATDTSSSPSNCFYLGNFCYNSDGRPPPARRTIISSSKATARSSSPQDHAPDAAEEAFAQSLDDSWRSFVLEHKQADDVGAMRGEYCYIPHGNRRGDRMRFVVTGRVIILL